MIKGEAEIQIALIQSEDKIQKEVETKVFHTQDWVAKPTDKSRDRVPVDFDVFGSGTKEIEKLSFYLMRLVEDISLLLIMWIRIILLKLLKEK